MSWKKIAITDILTFRNGWFRGDWKNDIAMSGPKYFGPGYDKLLPLGHPMGAPIYGEEALNLLKQHEIVVTQHLCSPDFYRALREGKTNVEKVFQWFDWEAVPTRGYIAPGLEELGEWLKAHSLIGTRENSYGSWRVDPFETYSLNWQDYPHAWCSDVRNSFFAKEYIERILGILEPYSGLINGPWFDNCMDRNYFGSATNAPDVASLERDFVRTLKGVLWGARKATLGEIWGNCSAWSRYKDLDGKWDELAMVQSPNPTLIAFDTRKSFEESFKDRGRVQFYAFNPEVSGHGITWLKDSGGRWEELFKLTQDLNGLHLVTFRSGKFVLYPKVLG